MEVGKDYIVIRAIRSWRKRRWLALSMIAVGVLLLISTAGYYVYGFIARSQLDDLDYTVSPGDLALPSTTSTPVGGGYSPGNATPTPTGVAGSSPATVALLPSSFITVYPGKLLPSLFWDSPRWSDVAYDSYTSLFEGFTLTSGSDPAMDRTLPPTWLVIPAIGLSSSVKSLQILDLGDVRAYETPKNVVGHIPEYANPGEVGNVYLFGHLQSPLKGEGAVFRKLPEIPDLLRQGQKVYLVLYNNEDTAYLYQVSQTRVLHKDDFALETSGEAVVTLVTCVPEWYYDYRLLVTARLVGVKR